MIAPSQVVSTARTFLDTPFQHQGRVKGVGIDCIGLPIMVAKALNLGDFDTCNYPRNPDGSMLPKIADICKPVIIQPGALLVFKISVNPQHCGIVTSYQPVGYGLIHTWDVVGKVVEHKLSHFWLAKVVGCYGFPGVDYE